MNDPIKNYVEEHREEFDHLEAPVFKLADLKAKLKTVQPERKRTLPMFNANRWLVAASILVLMVSAWLFLSRDRVKPETGIAQKKSGVSKPTAADRVDRVDTELPAQQFKARLVNNITKPKQVDTKVTPALYVRLKDSTSASSRLLAILEIEKTGAVDRQMMDRLAETLNKDGNTNVRLAALSLMAKYSRNQHVSALLVNSLDKQSDPMVQLGLLSHLGKMKNIKIDDKLKSLADGPDTFTAVRDEAFNILLNQNKF